LSRFSNHGHSDFIRWLGRRENAVTVSPGMVDSGPVECCELAASYGTGSQRGDKQPSLTSGTGLRSDNQGPSSGDSGASVMVCAGVETGSLPPEPSGNQGALIKLSSLDSLGSVARTRKSRLLGTRVRVNGRVAKAILDPGCEAEVVISSQFAAQCGSVTKVSDLSVELPDGTRLST
jgi:hypothetical protein